MWSRFEKYMMFSIGYGVWGAVVTGGFAGVMFSLFSIIAATFALYCAFKDGEGWK